MSSRPAWRLVPVAVGAWAAAAGATLVSPTHAVEFVAVAGLGALLLRRRHRLGALLIGVAAGSGSAALHVHALRVGPVPVMAREHADADVIARVVRDPVGAISPNGARLTIVDATVTSVRIGRWFAADSPVVVLAYGGGWDGVLPGQRVELAARLLPPRPGDDVAAVVEARSPPTLRGRPPWWQRAAGRARRRLREAASGLPPDERGLLPSLVDGDTSGVPPSLQADMRVTGLTHLEAVSGENVTVVIGVVLAVARAAGIRRRGRAVMCAVGLLSFVVLARPSPSVLRAAVMGAVALIARVAGRRSSALPALAAAVSVLVIVNPFLARAVGFVLSVVATAALVLLAPRWTARLERRLPGWLAAAVAVPAAAQLACTPVLVLVFGQLTPYAVAANLLAAPAVVPATVLGVAAAVVASISPTVAVPISWLGAAPTSAIAWTARGFAGLPDAALRWSGGVGATAVGGLAVVAAIRVCTRRPNRPDRVGAP
jgi:competence protein ComEC